jgi:alpha-N-arabinofuranosidase
MFELYRKHFGTLPLTIEGNSPQPSPKWPVGGDQPNGNAGSPTYPLDMSAALTADRSRLTVAVVNATEVARSASLKVQGIDLEGTGQEWKIAGTSLGAQNKAGKPAEVRITEDSVQGLSAITVAPTSVTIFVFTVKNARSGE